MADQTHNSSESSNPRRRKIFRKGSTPRFRFPKPRIRMWTDEPKNFEYLDDHRERRRLTLETIEKSGFGWWVVFVAGVGFLTDAYDIFALNMVLPMIGYVYYERGSIPWQHTLILKCATLIGTMFGQIGFGILGDYWGRRKMYGFELLIIIFATLGVAQCSPGVGHSMSLIGWLFFWRLLMGIGIGGDYPLSAAITAEFAPTKHRSRMMAALFWMQPLGQLLSTLVAMAVIAIFRKQIPDGVVVSECSDLDGDCARVVDTIWRWIIGVGAVPAIIAVFFRLTIPESPRYTLDILNNTRKAQETVIYFKVQPPTEIDLAETTTVVASEGVDALTQTANNPQTHLNLPGQSTARDAGIASGLDIPGSRPLGGGLHHSNTSGLSYINSSIQTAPSADTFRLPSPAFTIHRPSSIRQNFSNTSFQHGSIHHNIDRPTDENFETRSYYAPSRSSRTAEAFKEESCLRKASRADIKQYFITEGNWKDLAGTAIAWCLLDLSFYGLSVHSPRGLAASLFLTAGQELDSDPSAMISLWDMSIHSLIIVSIGAVLGGAVMIKLARYWSRKKIQFYGFLILAVLLLVMGSSLAELVGKRNLANLRGIMIMLCVLCQFFFNFGPNTTTFIIPAEAFPTRYRCTAHGLSAAAGKIGSVISQIIFITVRRNNRGVDDDPELLGHCMKGFAGIMIIGAIVTHYMVPETCDADGKSRTLEELSGGRLGREECMYRDKARKERREGVVEGGLGEGWRSGVTVREREVGSGSVGGSLVGSTLGRGTGSEVDTGEGRLSHGGFSRGSQGGGSQREGSHHRVD